MSPARRGHIATRPLRARRTAVAVPVVDDAELLARQARRNALRTFLQGLGIDVLVAIATVLATFTTSVQAWQGWTVVGVALARSVVGAVASYIMRRFVDGSRIPTPLPIAPEAAPAELDTGEVVEVGDP